MIQQQLGAGITRYAFDPRPGSHFGFNIIALEHQNRIVLIDTAFEAQAGQVLQALETRRLSVEMVIVSHFHDDHIYGLKALPR